MKKIGLLVMTIFFFLPTTTVLANDNTACPSPYTDKMQENVEEFLDKDATVIQSYIMEFAEAVLNMFNINTINQLVFDNPYCIWFEGGDYESAGLQYGLYPADLKTEVVDPLFSVFSGIYFLSLTLAMMILGLKMGYSALSVHRVRWHYEIGMFFIASFMMTFYVFGIEWLFIINNSIVMSIGDILSSAGVNTSFGYISTSLIENAKTLEFSDILFLYAEWIILFFLNLLYLLRLFVISVLMILGGLAIIAFLFEKGRQFFKYWLMGLISTVFIQSIHAVYLGIVLLFISIDSIGIIFKFLLLLMFLPITTLLMSWMGMADGLLSGKVAQDTVNKAGRAHRMASMFKGRVSKGNSPTLADSVGASKISELAKGNPSWQKVRKAAGTANGALAAAAGMTIGTGGAMLASSAANKATTGAMQLPRNAIAGIKGLAEAGKDIKDNKLSLENIQDKRQHYGKIGESIGVMFGKGKAGRGIGHALSGVSRQRLLNSNELGGLNGASMESIVAQNPGANIEFQQTNEGSAFYLNNGEEMQRVSPIGAADPSLKDGQTRTIDYNARTMTGDTPLNSMDTQPLLTRTSGAYIKDSNNQSFQDAAFNPNSVQMQDYYQANQANGKNMVASDKWADRIDAWGNKRVVNNNGK